MDRCRRGDWFTVPVSKKMKVFFFWICDSKIDYSRSLMHVCFKSLSTYALRTTLSSCEMMKYMLPAVLLVVINAVAAFHVAVYPRHRLTTPATGATPTSLHFMFPKEFERAVECASNAGLCKVDELNRLADELEAFQGCFFEDAEDCEQEEVDRQDVADILRMDAALQLRQVYLNNVNLFKERVDEARDTIEDERDEVLQTMERAIECASEAGLCKDEELNSLADDLEAFKGCLIEDDCEQEQVDRQDVVDILRMDSALQLRQVYLKNVNLFKEAVEAAQTMGEDRVE